MPLPCKWSLNLAHAGGAVANVSKTWKALLFTNYYNIIYKKKDKS